MSQFAVILPAAGKSSRFGGMEKKPFVSLEGRPVWQRAAEVFWKRNDVSMVYLVIAPEDRDDFRTRFGHYVLLNDKIQIVDGGAERFESVANAIAKVPEDVPFVAVHDAVRPLVSNAVVDEVFFAAKEHGAAMPALPVADTLKQVDSENRITATVPRAGLWQAQTPQVARREWLLEAYAKRASLTSAITDDAQLLEATGRTVVVVRGSVLNFKITTKEDLELAEAVVKSRAAKSGNEPTAPKWGAFDDDAKW